MFCLFMASFLIFVISLFILFFLPAFLIVKLNYITAIHCTSEAMSATVLSLILKRLLGAFQLYLVRYITGKQVRICGDIYYYEQ